VAVFDTKISTGNFYYAKNVVFNHLLSNWKAIKTGKAFCTRLVYALYYNSITLVRVLLISLSHFSSLALQNNNTNNQFVATIQINLCIQAHEVKNWKILLEQSCTACMLLLVATSTFRLQRKCYLQFLPTWLQKTKIKIRNACITCCE